MSLRPRSVFWLALACACGLALGLGRPHAADPQPDPENFKRHLRLGMPAKAEADETSKDAFLIKKEFFTISYNNSKGIPNWVAWNLVKSDFGDAPRPDPGPFHPDDDLPASFLKVRPGDYKASTTGFDRGHMCPNADRDFSEERATKTFVMTNMVPQTPELNRKAWASLEKYCRRLVERENQELFVYAGPAGKGGWSEEGYFNTTNGKVVVPAKCWKVIVCLPTGKDDPPDPVERVKATTRVIAVIMPNDQTHTKAWGKWRVRVKDVEELTDYTFFDKVPEAVRKVLREKLDEEVIPGG